jgi:hypothetical protein
VTTAAAESNECQLTVATDGPGVTGLQPLPIEIGEPLLISGRALRAPLHEPLSGPP